MNAILEVRALTKQYKKSGFRLNDISFSLPGGAIMGLVGENGAGKTTAIGCILNTLVRDGGTIKIFGKEMDDKSSEIRDGIGVVFDANHFSEDLTAAKISRVLTLVYSGWDNDLFRGYLDRFELPEKQRINNFSRGMTMKLGIAAALSHRPKLLILDEATSGLDPIARDEMLDIFLDFVRDEDHSILFSSHITADLEKIADYIAFIHGGNLVFCKKKDDLVYSHAMIRCTAAQFSKIDSFDILAYKKRDYQIDVLVSDRQSAGKKYRDFVIDSVSIEDIMLMLVKGDKS